MFVKSLQIDHRVQLTLSAWDVRLALYEIKQRLISYQ